MIDEEDKLDTWADACSLSGSSMDVFEPELSLCYSSGNHEESTGMTHV
jgi:hypothetical protein